MSGKRRERVGKESGKRRESVDRDKEATRDAVRLTIQDYLWIENTGLPEIYPAEDVRNKTEAVFVDVFRAYRTVPSPYTSPQRF